MKHLFLGLIVVFSYSLDCFAKAYFQTKSEMIERAGAIALVRIGDPEPSVKKGKHWTYRQQAKVRVESVLKGKLPDQFMLYGAETFICAQCSIDTGYFVVFLKKDGELWTGSNWHLSLRGIKDGQVDWFVADESRFEMAPRLLSDVIKEIELIVRKVPSLNFEGAADK